MAVPSSNILSQALTAIRCEVIQYFAAASRTVNDVGEWLTTYNIPLTVYGSFQPVPKRLYEELGLDLAKSYYVFYSLQRIIDIKRDVSNDQLLYMGERFQCESNTGWYREDGWDAVLCCKLDVPILATNIFGFNTLPQENNYTNFGNGNFYVG